MSPRRKPHDSADFSDRDPDEDFEAPDEYDQTDPDDETEPCPKCGRDIHYESEWCPHCAEYLSREEVKSGLPTWAVLLLLVAGLAVVFFGVLRR